MLMAQYGLTQAALARASGERQQDVNRFFTDQMKYPPLDFLDNLARVFQVTLADVLADELPRPALTDVQVRLLAQLQGMDPKDRWAIEHVVARAGASESTRPRRRRQEPEDR